MLYSQKKTSDGRNSQEERVFTLFYYVLRYYGLLPAAIVGETTGIFGFAAGLPFCVRIQLLGTSLVASGSHGRSSRAVRDVDWERHDIDIP